MKPLRIFQVIPNSGTIPSSSKSSIWKNNLYSPLVEMGNEVVLLDYDYDEFFVQAENSTWLDKHRPAFSEALLSKFREEQSKGSFDLCFIYLCDGFVDIGVIKHIQSTGVPVLNYSCNNIHQFHLVKEISRVVDCCIYTELHAGEKFKEIGAEAIQMQMAANPAFYRPVETAYIYEASFVGQRYADRGELIVRLIKAGIDAHAFGPRWLADGEKVGTVKLEDRLGKIFTIARNHGVAYTVNYLLNKYRKGKSDRNEDMVIKEHAGGILSDDEMVKAFSETKINLGFATVYSAAREGGEALYHLRLRDFEIPMCGGFYLTRYTEELEDYFEIGKEIECYKSTEELIDKCRHYLSHDERREEIRRAGLKRSLKDHTWNNRFTQLFANPKIRPLLRID